MRYSKDFKTEEEVDGAHKAAMWGAASGAARWGLISAAVGTCAYMFSPVFRRLTVQFKVFLQIAPMVMGGMIEADRRMVAYELLVRQHKRLEKDRLWKADYEKQFEDVDDATLEKAIRDAELRSRMSSQRDRRIDR